MGLGGGLFQFKTFGNMTHPNVLRKIDFYHCIDLNIPKKLMQTNNHFSEKNNALLHYFINKK